MPTYEGVATIYMTMPMANQTLPLMGTCSVTEKKVSLKFPLSGVSFDLPQAPSETGAEMEFKMTGARGELTLKIGYRQDIQAFFGKGIQDGLVVMSFVFFRPNSTLRHLKEL